LKRRLAVRVWAAPTASLRRSEVCRCQSDRPEARERDKETYRLAVPARPDVLARDPLLLLAVDFLLLLLDLLLSVNHPLLVPLELLDEPVRPLRLDIQTSALLLLLLHRRDDLAEQRDDHVVLARLLVVRKLLLLVFVRQRRLETKNLLGNKGGSLRFGRRDKVVDALDERVVHRHFGLELLELELALLALLVDVALLPAA
jgi:hypothetical protein